MIVATLKPRRCKHCRDKFMPDRIGQTIHTDCIEGYCLAIRAKRQSKEKAAAKIKNSQERAQYVARKEKLKTNGQRKAEAQRALNHWVVHVRDAAQPCISCGRMHEGVWHAGHYRSRGSAPHLALDPRNLAKQCAPCNLHLHGNLIAFRLGLIDRHGVAHVEALEADQEPRHYAGADYDALKAEYRALTKQLKKEKA